jgi:hypothetical protein
MGCSKYSLINTGSTVINFNYQKCEDALWEYQVELRPGETKNIWFLTGTFSIAPFFNQEISINNEGVFPPLPVTPTPTPSETPAETPTPTPTPTTVPFNDLSDLIIPNDDVTYIIL